MQATAQANLENPQSDVAGRGLTIDVLGGGAVTLKGDVMTAQGGDLPVPPQHQSLYAFMSDGRLIVAIGKRRDATVGTFIAKAKAKGHVVKEIIEADITEIKRIYANAGSQDQKKVARYAVGDERSVLMRREFVELVGRAATKKATDIHIETDEIITTIEFRIDGDIQRIMQETNEYARQLMAAAFAMADASDPTYNEANIQDASIINSKGELSKAVQSLRLHWNPTMLGGRHLAIRVHPRHVGGRMDLIPLGFTKAHLETFRQLRRRSKGIIVNSGATGDGKSTTLMHNISLQYQENGGRKKIIEVADPPEAYIPGVIQIPVTNANLPEERRVKLVQTIMAALRSNPNILVVGEVRDYESGTLAYDAANTGHLVWTTLHTNSAVDIPNRMISIGLEPYKCTDPDVVIGMIGQRLLPVLCPHCRITAEQGVRAGTVAQATLDAAIARMKELGIEARLHAKRPDGCEHCEARGTMGRTVAAEMLLPDEEFMDHCRNLDGGKSRARAHWIKELGGHTILAHAMAKMAAGIVSPESVDVLVAPLMSRDASLNRVPEIMKIL